MTPQQITEWLICAESAPYFVDRYCAVYDATTQAWRPFSLWPAQRRVLKTLQRERLIVLLKARQLGMSWLSLGFCLWHLLFEPGGTTLLFSRRDDEAVELLAMRLKGMYARLPDWLRSTAPVVISNDHVWMLGGGSRVLAFPASGGDSYTASLAIVDEADLVPDLGALMRAVKPTIDAGGKLLLLSRADKSQPQSAFKQYYRAAKTGNDWTPIFLPWSARPDRDTAWYAAQRRDILSRTGALDDLHEQYPATDVEALAPRSLDKRIPAAWLDACYQPTSPIDGAGPPLPHLAVFRVPERGRRYVIGADPAEGNPTSDDSALSVVDRATGAEVANLAGKVEPATFGSQIASVSHYFNGASVLCERNNHGHAVILWLRDNAPDVPLLDGWDAKTGWLSNSKGKALLYDGVAEDLGAGDARIAALETYLQLAAIAGGSLRAPPGEHDDRADSYALAQQARRRSAQHASTAPSSVITTAQLFTGTRR